jgi:hypothetical protein
MVFFYINFLNAKNAITIDTDNYELNKNWDTID